MAWWFRLSRVNPGSSPAVGDLAQRAGIIRAPGNAAMEEQTAIETADSILDAKSPTARKCMSGFQLPLLGSNQDSSAPEAARGPTPLYLIRWISQGKPSIGAGITRTLFRNPPEETAVEIA